MNLRETINDADLKEILSLSGRFLTHREKEFLVSLRERITRSNGGSKSLSYSQARWLRAIEEKYSPEKLEELEEWEKSFGPAHRDIARRVAIYYKENPPYFQNQVAQVLDDSDSFILSKSDWEKLCENKYALKIRSIYKEPLKFKVSDCIQIRVSNRVDIANATRGRYLNRQTANRVGFVLETDAKPVTRAAKGSRIYKILLTGEAAPIYAHESDLKKARNKK